MSLKKYSATGNGFLNCMEGISMPLCITNLQRTKKFSETIHSQLNNYEKIILAQRDILGQ
jgi:hypothetical protein